MRIPRLKTRGYEGHSPKGFSLWALDAEIFVLLLRRIITLLASCGVISPLEASVVHSEPPDVFWENLAVQDTTIRANEWTAQGLTKTVGNFHLITRRAIPRILATNQAFYTWLEATSIRLFKLCGSCC